MESTCIQCGGKPKRPTYRYCSNKCQLDSQYRAYIEKWQKGEVDGGRGVRTRNLSEHVKRYLREKYGEKCSKCGWCERHPVTNRIPLEVDHLDGDAENNNEANLLLLCPNCHSLTPGFRNLNIGKGRSWRKQKYLRLQK